MENPIVYFFGVYFLFTHDFPALSRFLGILYSLASLGWLHCGDLPLLQFTQPVVYSLGTVQLPSRNTPSIVLQGSTLKTINLARRLQWVNYFPLA